MSDRDAEFLEYVTAHRGRMLRTARLLASGDAHWAEDLVQVALTKLYVHWSKVRREDGAARYADRILVNAFLDERQRTWRRREATTEQMDDPEPPPAQDPAERLTVLTSPLTWPAAAAPCAAAASPESPPRPWPPSPPSVSAGSSRSSAIPA